MAKPAKKTSKSPAKSSKPSKPAAKKISSAKKPAASSKSSARPAASSKAVKAPAKKAVPKSAGKVTAKTKSSAAVKASKPAAKVSKPVPTKAPAASSSTQATKKPSGKVVAATAISAAALGAAIGAAANVKKKSTGTTGAANAKAASRSTMTNKPTAHNQEEPELRIGVVQPATKTMPAMRLSVNDAEILATAKERYGTKDLEAFKKLILEQRAEASEEFDILSEQMLDTSGEFDADNQTFSLHTAEQGTDAMEREKTFLHAQRTSDYIKKLDEALQRIDRGTYGICVVCGKLIEKPRLQAVPITQKHVDCKNRTQQKKLSVDQPFRDMDQDIAVE